MGPAKAADESHVSTPVTGVAHASGAPQPTNIMGKQAAVMRIAVMAVRGPHSGQSLRIGMPASAVKRIIDLAHAPTLWSRVQALMRRVLALIPVGLLTAITGRLLRRRGLHHTDGFVKGGVSAGCWRFGAVLIDSWPAGRDGEAVCCHAVA